MTDVHDFVLRRGRIIDGSGAPSFYADVAIDGDRITTVGEVGKGKREYDAEGLIVSPGFIDIHTHSDFTIFNNPLAAHAVLQGVTLEVVGNCGFSIAPLSDEFALDFQQLVRPFGEALDWNWRTVSKGLEALERARPAQNIAPLVGHGAIRAAVRGLGDGTPTEAEQAAMRHHVEEALNVGYWGLSTGLAYPPGRHAEPKELVDLARVVARAKGLYATHMRNEGEHLLESIGEALHVGREAGVRVQISHLKASGRAHWGRVRAALAVIEEARESGVQVAVDFYPYEAGSTMLSAVLPPWALDGGIASMIERLRDPEVRAQMRAQITDGISGWWNPYQASGGWTNIVIVSVGSEQNRFCEGLSVNEAAGLRSQDPFDFVFDLLLAEEGEALMVGFYISPKDVTEVACYRHAALGSDAVGVLSPGRRAHPRAYGAFARFLSQSSRDATRLELPELIRRMTALPANLIGLQRRGLLAEGYAADIVAFDPDAIVDCATYREPASPPEGVRLVMINGVVAAENDQLTGERPGRVLRRGQGGGSL